MRMPLPLNINVNVHINEFGHSGRGNGSPRRVVGKRGIVLSSCMAVPPAPNGSREDDVAAGDVDVSIGRLLRDFVAFELKLLVDGFKDVMLAQLALIIMAIELLFRGGRRGRLFYGLMRIGARFERWLGLYEPHSRETAIDDPDTGVAARLGRANRILRDAEQRIFKTTADD